MATVRITGNWRTMTKLEWAGAPNLDAHGRIERSISLPGEAFQAIEREIAAGKREGILYLPDGRRFGYFVDGALPAKSDSSKGAFVAVDANAMPWEERFSEQIGKAIYRKELFADPDTGMIVRLVRYPAGVINPSHTHPCGHGMYVLEGQLVTHNGAFGPGSFVWFPEGEVMEHGASAAGDVVAVFITNKPFRIDYVHK